MGKYEVPLVERALAGDREAFDLLSTSVRPWVFGLCLRLLRDSQLAEDLTQDILLQAYRALPQLRQLSRFRTWLSRIALNTCRMYLRAQTATPVELTNAVLLEPIASQQDSPQFGLDQALTRLDPLNRRVLVLFYDEGLSQSEIAELLSLSEAAVKSRMHRAREQLRKEMVTTMSDAEKMKLGVTEETSWVLRTVLLAEPEAELCEAIRTAVLAAGFEVAVLPTGEAALEAVAQHRGQMLILDKECVEPNWIEVITLLRVDAWSRVNLPILVFAGPHDPTHRRDALLSWQAGADAYLTKPFHIEEVVQLVHHIAKMWGKEIQPMAPLVR